MVVIRLGARQKKHGGNVSSRQSIARLRFGPGVATVQCARGAQGTCREEAAEGEGRAPLRHTSCCLRVVPARVTGTSDNHELNHRSDQSVQHLGTYLQYLAGKWARRYLCRWEPDRPT